MALSDLYKVVIESSVYGEACFNVFWYRQMTADGGTLNIADALADQVEAWYCDELSPLMSEDASFVGVSVYNYTNSEEFGLNTVVNVGAIAQPSAPSQWCIGFKFARPGIGWNYPRKRVSGFPLSAYVENAIEPSLAATLQSLADEWQTYTIDGATLQWKIIRPGTGFALDNPVVTAERNVGTCISVYDASQMTRKN